MSGIPSKCPKCGKPKAWKEEINPHTSGIPTAFGRVRTGIIIKGLFAKPLQALFHSEVAAILGFP